MKMWDPFQSGQRAAFQKQPAIRCVMLTHKRDGEVINEIVPLSRIHARDVAVHLDIPSAEFRAMNVVAAVDERGLDVFGTVDQAGMELLEQAKVPRLREVPELAEHLIPGFLPGENLSLEHPTRRFALKHYVSAEDWRMERQRQQQMVATLTL